MSDYTRRVCVLVGGRVGRAARKALFVFVVYPGSGCGGGGDGGGGNGVNHDSLNAIASWKNG